MPLVSVTGPDGALRRRVVAALEGAGTSVAIADLANDHEDRVPMAVYLPSAWASGSEFERPAALHRLLRTGVGSVVYVSSAAVYGAWPDNPIPLTENAPLRPNPGIAESARRAEGERLIAQWAAEDEGRSAAVLRPAPIVGGDTRLARAMAGARVRVRDSDPPRQFLHVDDVAEAVALVVTERVTGTFNLAPDGWITGETMRELAAHSVAVPAAMATPAASWAWRARVSSAPPAMLPLLSHPWVVANDRLRGLGWTPRYSNEEALVAGRPGSRWREMSPQRRQEVALGLSAAGAAAAVAALVSATVAARRRNRP
jgi:hypothetical protein